MDPEQEDQDDVLGDCENPAGEEEMMELLQVPEEPGPEPRDKEVSEKLEPKDKDVEMEQTHKDVEMEQKDTTGERKARWAKGNHFEVCWLCSFYVAVHVAFNVCWVSGYLESSSVEYNGIYIYIRIDLDIDIDYYRYIYIYLYLYI